jgi:hypothetical protein
MRDQDAAALLAGEPPGVYVVERRGRWRVLWRISEGATDDEPAAPEPGSMTPWITAIRSDRTVGGASATTLANTAEHATTVAQFEA